MIPSFPGASHRASSHMMIHSHVAMSISPPLAPLIHFSLWPEKMIARWISDIGAWTLQFEVISLPKASKGGGERMKRMRKVYTAPALTKLGLVRVRTRFSV